MRELVSLLLGGFAAPPVRRQLWQSWGLCRRHFWWYAAVDFELHGEPFRAAILCEELLERAVAQLRLSLVRPSRRILGLRSTAGCSVCEAVASDPLTPASRMPDWERRRLARVQSLVASRPAFVPAEPYWTLRACPACVDGRGPLCRAHLLDDGNRPARGVEVRALAGALDALERRLHGLVQSMCWPRQEVPLETSASWVEAVGWLAGWPAPWTSGGSPVRAW